MSGRGGAEPRGGSERGGERRGWGRGRAPGARKKEAKGVCRLKRVFCSPLNYKKCCSARVLPATDGFLYPGEQIKKLQHKTSRPPPPPQIKPWDTQYRGCAKARNPHSFGIAFSPSFIWGFRKKLCDPERIGGFTIASQKL